MGPGLHNLLDLIERSPTESMLVDRVLVLASDVPEFERVEVTLKLAKVLLSGNPRRALEISWMLYKSGLRDLDALMVIADAFDHLKKPTKAKVIREELRRLKNDTLSDFAKGSARATIEKQVSDTLLGAEDVSESIDEVTKTNAKSIPASFSAGEADLFFSDSTKVDEKTNTSLKSSPEGVNADNNHTVPFDWPVAADGKESAEQSKLPENKNSANKLELQPTEFISEGLQTKHVINPDRPPRATAISVRKITAAEGIPEAIPPRQPSQLEMVKTSISQVRGKDHFVDVDAVKKDWKQAVSDCIRSENWEHLLQILDNDQVATHQHFLLRQFEDHKLWKLDIRFAMLWIDVLINSHEERRAIRFSYNKLCDEPHLAWARQIYPKMVEIAGRLNLNMPPWRESEGAEMLKNQITQMMPVGGQYLVAGRPKAS
jgi:hypothetical protein